MGLITLNLVDVLSWLVIVFIGMAAITIILMRIAYWKDNIPKAQRGEKNGTYEGL